ncbi:MAG: endonuclease III [Treponema sp.]|nr:endonuclease III [Treponema sp.]
MEPNWAGIFKSLERWRKEIFTLTLAEDTAITSIAEQYGGEGTKPWAVLLSTILSLRTKDDVTRLASLRLLEKAPGPRELLKLGVKETACLAYPVGFYRNKALSLNKIAKILIEEHRGQVPADLDELLKLPGVGRKTANLVLTEAFNKYGICVDIHVHRICNRAGWIETSNPDKTEIKLREILPKRYWKRINNLLVLYGQNLCRPISPFCSRCVIFEHCQKCNVGKSR